MKTGIQPILRGRLPFSSSHSNKTNIEAPGTLKIQSEFFSKSFCLLWPKGLGMQLFSFQFCLFEYSHVNGCTTELKIKSSKHIQEDFTLFWMSISSGSKSFQLYSKTVKLSTTTEGIKLNRTTEQCR